MECKSYFVRCITNLHMGSGDVNFNVVDNEVQKDPVTGYPTMFASGIKGALRDHFETIQGDKVEKIFGSSIQASREGNRDSSQQGNVRFLTANLLFLPVRAAMGPVSYFMVTTKGLLQTWCQMYETLHGKELRPGLGKKIEALDPMAVYAGNSSEAIKVEYKDYPQADIKSISKEMLEVLQEECPETLPRLLILPEEDLRNIPLPVVARNQLENGISKNLWYEELVPHESIFCIHVLSNGTSDGDQAVRDFDETIKKHPLVQFGGDATVGCGLTSLKEY